MKPTVVEAQSLRASDSLVGREQAGVMRVRCANAVTPTDEGAHLVMPMEIEPIGLFQASRGVLAGTELVFTRRRPAGRMASRRSLVVPGT